MSPVASWYEGMKGVPYILKRPVRVHLSNNFIVSGNSERGRGAPWSPRSRGFPSL